MPDNKKVIEILLSMQEEVNNPATTSGRLLTIIRKVIILQTETKETLADEKYSNSLETLGKKYFQLISTGAPFAEEEKNIRKLLNEILAAIKDKADHCGIDDAGKNLILANLQPIIPPFLSSFA